MIMKDIIIYIAEVGLFLSIFFLIYKLFFKSATFFRFNRIYLLTGLFASFILPLVQFSYDVPVFQTAAEIPKSHLTATTDISNNDANYIWIILSLIYLSGSLILLVRNMMEYNKIHRLIKTGKPTKNSQYVIIDNENISSPFSVFKYILLNRKNLTYTEQELILKHEITHVTQKHWFDLFCSQCALALQWFNPLAWLYISSLKENHEFLADRAVLDTGCSPTLYQAVLINQRFQGPVFSFTNSFNYSNHLKRLTMMKKMKSSPWKRLAVLALIPALGLCFWVSATPNYIIQDTGIKISTDDDKSGTDKNEKKKSKSISIKVVNTSSDSVKVIGYGSANEKNILDLNGAVFFIDGKEYTSEEMENSGIKIDVLKNTEIKPNKEKKVIVIKESDTKKDINTENVDVNVFTSDKKPLFIVDGKEVSDISNIKPESIESISVLKDKTATDTYGKKGENGVIEVILKK